MENETFKFVQTDGVVFDLANITYSLTRLPNGNFVLTDSNTTNSMVLVNTDMQLLSTVYIYQHLDLMYKPWVIAEHVGHYTELAKNVSHAIYLMKNKN